MEDRKIQLKRGDWRHNARIIFNNTNVLPFRVRSGLFMCAFCPIGFPYIDELRAHATEHKRNANETEKLILKSRSDVRWKVEISDMKCRLCCARLEDIEGARKHLIAIHNERFLEDHDSGVIPFKIKGNHYGCANCGEEYLHFKNLVVHMTEHYAVSNCPDCGKAFSNVKLMKSHFSNQHSNVKKNRKKVSNLKKCQFCNEICVGFYGKMKHLREVHDIGGRYACDLCPADFPSIYHKQNHLQRIHFGALNFACDKCPYRCFDGQALKDHFIISHGSGDKLWKCEVCDKAYLLQKSLITHMRIHDKDKWVACEICDYKCPKRWNLKTHMKNRHPEIDYK